MSKTIRASVASVALAASAEEAPAATIGHNGGPSMQQEAPSGADQQKDPFYIQVKTSIPGKDVIVDSRLCDIYNFQSRKWLTNHQFWAMHQGHTVELHTASSDEVAEYTRKQAQLLSRRYGK